MTAGQFWEFQFSYIETYSFNRGPKLAALHATTTAAIERIKQEMQTAPLRDQRKLAYQLRIWQAEVAHSISEKPLTGKQGAFDATADKLSVVRTPSEAAQRLDKIFGRPAGQVVHFMCLPIYRDALAFYNEQGQLLRVLNICFECLDMRTATGAKVTADVAAYAELQKLLVELGHPIEEN